MVGDSANARRENIFDKTISIIKVLPGVVVIGYAYIYLLGYFYLLSYFKVWGLSPSELGFSIVDYATVALYPLFFLLPLGLFTFAFGLLITNEFKSYYSKNKKNRIITALIAFIIIPTIISLIYFSIGTSDVLLKYSSFNLLFLYYAGVFIGAFKYLKIKSIKIFIIIILIFYIFALPFWASIVGDGFAKIYIPYTFNPLKWPNRLSSIVIYSNNPIDEFQIFQTDDNKYEGLMLLLNKNDSYYLVPDITKFQVFSEILDKENKEIRELIEEIESKLTSVSHGVTESSEIKYDQKINEINSNINELRTQTFPILEREEKLKKIDSNISALKEAIKKDKKIFAIFKNELSEIEQTNQKIGTKLKQFTEMQKIFSDMPNSIFEIKSDKVKFIQYLKKEEKIVKPVIWIKEH